MGPTLPADFVFEPKVWKDHIEAYFDKKLVFGAFALRDTELVMEKGTTINFPYFKAIGDAEKPAADESLQVDKLQDDSFNATVYEVGKAVGVRRAALKKSASSREKIFAEIQRQMGRVHAEQIDADLIAEINDSGNYIQGYTSAAAGDTMDIRKVLDAKITGFGDKHDHAVVIFMHSLAYGNLTKDTTAGFLKADATDPMYAVPGFAGRLLGMGVVVTDQCPAHAAIDGKTAYEAFICKPNAFGLLLKQEMDMEADYDILAREHVFASTQWYAVKSFHAKINSLDYKVCRMSVTTEVDA